MKSTNLEPALATDFIKEHSNWLFLATEKLREKTGPLRRPLMVPLQSGRPRKRVLSSIAEYVNSYWMPILFKLSLKFFERPHFTHTDPNTIIP